MSDTKPRVIPHVEGVRNPRRSAVAAALRAEIDAQDLNVKCLSKVIVEIAPWFGYQQLLAIVNGKRDPNLTHLAIICNVLAIRLEDLVATAATNTNTGEPNE